MSKSIFAISSTTIMKAFNLRGEVDQIGRGMNQILVIEDDSHILDFLHTVLTRLGYEVKIASDGETGIELFDRSQDFDLVITDIHMPGIDGNAVAKHIRRSAKPSTPIVAITGYKNDINRELFNFSLIKPFKLEHLVEVINSFK